MLSYIPSNRLSGYYDISGLSTDTKPIGAGLTNSNTDRVIVNGSEFFEINTKKHYRFMISESSSGRTGQWIYTYTNG